MVLELLEPYEAKGAAITWIAENIGCAADSGTAAESWL